MLMRPLIPDELNNKLNEIIGANFRLNRLMDRGMSILSTKFALIKCVNEIHPKLAHLYPLLADKISDFQNSRDNLSIYPETPIGNEDYSTPLEFFEKLLEYQINLEFLVGEALDKAKEEDIVTYVFLEHFLRKLNPVTDQILILINKLEMYGNDSQAWMLFDAHVKKFIIL
jgi:Ferritin-like domain